MAFVLLEFALLAASLILLKRWTRYRVGQISLSIVFWLTFLALFLDTVLGQFHAGDVSLPIFFLCFLSGYSYLFRHKLLSAFWLGLAIDIGVFPVFLLGLAILQRDWRFLGYVFALLALFAVAPTLFFGWDGNWQLHRAFLAELAGHGPEIAMRAAQVAAVGAAILVWWTFRRHMQSEWIVVYSFFLAFTAQIVPSSWVDQPGFFYAPLVLLTMTGWATHRRWPYSAAVAVLFCTWSLSAEGILGRDLNHLLEHWSVPTIGVWVFLVAAYVWWRRELQSGGKFGGHPPPLPHLAPGATSVRSPMPARS